MDGRAFLPVAEELSKGPTEAHWRAAAGRAYYSLMLEGRDALLRWGFACPPRDNLHTFVRFRFANSPDVNLRHVGNALDRLVRVRNQADYHLSAPGPFARAKTVVQAVDIARDAIARIDQIEADPARRAAAIAAIKAAWP